MNMYIQKNTNVILFLFFLDVVYERYPRLLHRWGVVPLWELQIWAHMLLIKEAPEAANHTVFSVDLIVVHRQLISNGSKMNVPEMK